MGSEGRGLLPQQLNEIEASIRGDRQIGLLREAMKERI